MNFDNIKELKNKLLEKELSVYKFLYPNESVDCVDIVIVNNLKETVL